MYTQTLFYPVNFLISLKYQKQCSQSHFDLEMSLLRFLFETVYIFSCKKTAWPNGTMFKSNHLLKNLKELSTFRPDSSEMCRSRIVFILIDWYIIYILLWNCLAKYQNKIFDRKVLHSLRSFNVFFIIRYSICLQSRSFIFIPYKVPYFYCSVW